MKFNISTLLFLLSSYCTFAQLPDCDIWLFDIKDSAGQIVFQNPINITHKKGYDNQPAFSPDSKYILFASQPDTNKPTDIYKYDILKKTTARLTNTPLSEYSPTFMPDGKNISVVMVEKDSTQRLWKLPLAGGPASLIMPNVDSIGYHCWINKDSLALFVLTKPFTLQLTGVQSQKPSVLADSLGRCMRMRDGALWYTTAAGHFSNVYAYSFKSKQSTFLGMIESEDFCFRGKESIWSCSDNTIVSGYMNSKSGAAEILNLEKYGITKPTRITVSPDGKKLAVVSIK